MDRQSSEQFQFWLSAHFFGVKTCCVVCHAYCFCYGGTNMARKMSENIDSIGLLRWFNFSQSGSRKNNRKAFEGASMEPTSFNLHNKSNVRWGCVQQIFYAENHWKVKRKSESLLSRTISVQITDIFKWMYLHVMGMCVWWISLVPLSYQKVVIRTGILPRDFLQSLENYHMWLTTAKIQALKDFHR